MNSGPEASVRPKGALSFGGAAAVALLLGISLPGCATTDQKNTRISSDTRMSLADIAASGGDIESARTILAAAAQADPNNGDLELRYAGTLLESGQAKEAVAAAKAAVQRSPRDVGLAVRAAQLELRAGDAGQAAATFQAAAERGGAGTAALNGLGVARVQMGDLPGAEDAFRHAIQMSPGDFAARNNLALALVLKGRAEDAVPMLQSLAAEPGVPNRVKHNLALAYARQGDTGQAATVLSEVIGTTAASREVATFNTLRTEAPTQMAGQFGPAEVLQGPTAGAAYAGVLPPRTGSAPTAASAQPGMTEAQVAQLLRPAPVASVQSSAISPPAPGASAAVPLAPPASPAPKVAVASAPASAQDVAAGVPPPTHGVAGTAPTVTTPAPPAAAAAPAPGGVEPASMTVTEPSDAGKIKVRIAAVPTRSAAMTLWQNLAGIAPDLLTGRTPLVRMARDNGHTSWHLGTGGFQDVAAAEQFCRKLRERGPNCAIGL